MEIKTVQEYAEQIGETATYVRLSANVYKERLPVYVFYNGEYHLLKSDIVCVIHGENSPKTISERTAERRANMFAERRKGKNIDYRKALKTKAKSLIGCAFKRACKGIYKRTLSIEQILGCSLDEFLDHLSSLFKDGMTFENHGAWHIDHKKPLRMAETEQDIINLNHYTNLQPLWAVENNKKHARYEQ